MYLSFAGLSTDIEYEFSTAYRMFPEVAGCVGSTCSPVLSEFGVPAIYPRFTQRMDLKDRSQPDQDGEITRFSKNFAPFESKLNHCHDLQEYLTHYKG